MAVTIASTELAPLKLNFGEGVYYEDAQAVCEQSNYAAVRAPQTFFATAFWQAFPLTGYAGAFVELYRTHIWITAEDDTLEFSAETQDIPTGSPSGTYTVRFNLNASNTDIAFTRPGEDGTVKTATRSVSSLAEGWYALTVSVQGPNNTSTRAKVRWTASMRAGSL